MDLNLIVGCLLIILARLIDVSLGTIRTIAIVQGRAIVAWILGFFEVLVWVFAVSQVMQNLDRPAYAIAYAFGFATGSYMGIKIESWLAFGLQVVRIFTKKGDAVATFMREKGFAVTTFAAEGRDGPVSLIFIETRRRTTPLILRYAATADPSCFYLVDDIRLAAHPAPVRHQPTGWRAVLKKK